MAASKVKPGWEYLGGKTRRYRNIATGQEISRRQYDQMFSPLSYEKKAAHNKKINPEKAILRPARGRKSYVRSDEWAQKEIAAQRLAALEKKKKEAEAQKRARDIQRRSDRKAHKKIKVRKVSKRYLPKGKIGWRLPFKTYDEYLTLLADAKATGVIHIYGLGFVGVDMRSAEERAITVYTMRSTSITEDEDDFNEAMETSIGEYSYLQFMHYFIFFGIDKEYVRAQK